MRNVWTICRKELNSYFASPIAYLAMAMFAVVFGFFFWNAVGYFVSYGLQAQMMGQPMPMDVNEMVIRPLLMNVSVVGLFLIPMIAMRLFAEEKRQGTIELLLTSPVHDAEIVIGKWMAAVALFATLLIISLVNILFLFAYGNPDWKPVVAGYLGLLLQAGALLAVGAFISTLTRNQIIAGIVTFAACLMLWILEWVAGYETASWAKVMAYLSVVSHFESFSKGVIDTKDLVYFVSLIFFGLCLSVRSIESLRWRA
jgi:ABC-2 type transport system permease protein